MTWEQLVAQAEALGFTVELVEYVECSECPGFLGAALGVCIYGSRRIRVREALREEHRVLVLEHELEHAVAYVGGMPREWHHAHDAESYEQPWKHEAAAYLWPVA